MEKRKPKKDGSGRGIRANRGRGGCVVLEKEGRGRRDGRRRVRLTW